MRWPLLLAVACSVATLAAPLRAQPASPPPPTTPTEATKAEAMRLYEDGARAYEQERYHDAVDLFLAADRLVENPAFAYNIAVSYARVGDTSRALRWAREYLRRAPASERSPEMSTMVETMQRRLEERGVQQLTVLTLPRGATVSVDGTPRGVTPWTGDLVPGAHTLEVRLPGHADATRSVLLPRDRALDVELTLEPLPEPTTAAPPLPPTAPPTATPILEAPTPTSEGELPVAPWTIAILGGAAVAIGASIGLEVARGGAERDARAATTQLDALAAAERMDDFRVGARVAVGIGAGLVAVGGALLVVDLVGGDDAPTLQVRCGPAVCGPTFSGSF